MKDNIQSKVKCVLIPLDYISLPSFTDSITDMTLKLPPFGMLIQAGRR